MIIRTIILGGFLLFSFWTIAAQPSASGVSATLSFGDPKAEYRIEVFYDLQCPTCASYHATLKNVIERFPQKVFVIVRHFPLPMHDQAFMASSAVEAANKQGKGVEMMDLLLEEQSKWSVSPRPFQLVLGYAKRLGIETKKFQDDVTSEDVARTVILDMNRAKRLGVGSTPSVFLNGKLMEYAESLQLEEIIAKGN